MTVVGSPGGRSTRDGSWRGLLFGLALALALHALMLQERHRLPKIRATVDFLADWMQQTHPPLRRRRA